MTVVYEWKRTYGVDLFNKDHKEGVRKLLNSPDYRYLKTDGIKSSVEVISDILSAWNEIKQK